MESIKELRKKANLTQEDLAEKMGVTVNTVQNWENQRTEPKREVLNRLLKELGITDQNEQAKIIGELGVSNYQEEKNESYDNLPFFLFEENSEVIELIKKCYATAEELDMLGYADYLTNKKNPANSYPMEFAFFEKNGGFNMTMKKMTVARRRLGGLLQEALDFARQNPECDYRLLSLDLNKIQMVEKIGILLNEKNYLERIIKLNTDLMSISTDGLVYNINGVLQNNDISRKISKAIVYSSDNKGERKQNLGIYEGYITIVKKENDSKEYLELKNKYLAGVKTYEKLKDEQPGLVIQKPVFKEQFTEIISLTERGRQLIECFSKA